MFVASYKTDDKRYQTYIIRADNHGEGGILALMALVRGKRATVNRGPENTVMSWPHLFWAELAVFMVTVVVTLILSYYSDAPLKELANAAIPENPAKAPWYFLGLQELVSHSALLGGVIVPTLAVLALLAIPYVDSNPSRRPADRKWAIRVFTLFVAINVILIVVGTFFRGPGWAFVPPWVHIAGGE